MSHVKTVRTFLYLQSRFINRNPCRKSFLPLINIIPHRLVCSNDVSVSTNKKPSLLEPAEKQDLSHYGPLLMPTYNLAAYADKSPLLQEFIKLGVELHEFDKNPLIGEFLLPLDFEKNIKPYLLFLHENGVSADNFGKIITKFPFLFKQDLDDLQTRINYLKSKKFTDDMISHIITVKPSWLSIPVKQIDKRLGYLQQTFKLTGDEVRKIVTSVPGLGTRSLKFLNETIYCIREELQLNMKSQKKIICQCPSLLKKSPVEFVPTYDYLLKVMKVQEILIIQQPQVLLCRKFILQQRHKFLESLGKAQYVPHLPGYVSLLDLVKTNDEEFCKKIAKTSIQIFYDFIKTS